MRKNVTIRIKTDDGFSVRNVKEALSKSLFGTGYNIENLKVYEDTTNYGVMKQAFDESLSILDFDVEAMNIDQRQLFRGIHIAGDEDGDFTVDSIVKIADID